MSLDTYVCNHGLFWATNVIFLYELEVNNKSNLVLTAFISNMWLYIHIHNILIKHY